MAKQNFSELIEYLDKQFQENTRAHGILNTKISDLYSSVDAYAHKADAYFQEMTMLSHQVDRHERWLEQIADKVGLKLKH